MGNHEMKPMTEGGIWAMIAVLMAMVGLYVPLVGIVVRIIWPLPIIILVVRHGVRWGIMASVVAGILIAILTHPLKGISMVSAFGTVGIIMGYAYRKNYGAAKCLLMGMTAAIIAKIVVLGLAMAVTNMNPFLIQFDMLKETLAGSLEMYRDMGVEEQHLAAVKQNFGQALETVQLMIPAIIALVGIIEAYINFIMAGKVLRRIGAASVPELQSFSEWRFPLVVAYLYAFSWVGIYWGSSREWSLLLQISMNVNMFSSVLGFIQGLAVVAAMTAQYNLSKWVRGILLFFVLTNGFFLRTIGLIGLFDIVVDYRRRMARRK